MDDESDGHRLHRMHGDADSDMADAGQHIKNRARNDPGILATDIKSVSRGLSSMRVMCLENGIRN